MWVTKKFPIKIHGLDVLQLCTNSCELNDRLQAASVHWLLVSQQGGLHLPIQHYKMAFCMELERQYKDGLHVVEKTVQPCPSPPCPALHCPALP